MSTARQPIRYAPPAREAPAVINLPPPKPRRRAGRRRVPDPRTAITKFRTTPALKASIYAAAEDRGLTITDYILSHLPEGEAKPNGARAVSLGREAKQVLVLMLAELGKWGSNWNQLARDRNITGREPDSDELRHIRAALETIRDRVTEALGR